MIIAVSQDKIMMDQRNIPLLKLSNNSTLMESKHQFMRLLHPALAINYKTLYAHNHFYQIATLTQR